jgi:tripartite-type tricarboxylate transporter receptor subunit TctC
VAPAVIPKLSYDVLKDFAGVTMVLTNPASISVPQGSPIRSMQDLIARARKEPGKLTYASVGIGSGGHILALTVEQAAGISLLHVPYRGGPQALEAIVSAQVDTYFGILNAVMPSVRASKVRVIAVDERTSFLPDVPSLADIGIKETTGKAFVAMFAPAATPRPVIQRLHQAVSEIMRRAPVRDKFVAMAAEPAEMTPEQLDAFMREQVAYYRKAIEQFKLPTEQ